MPASAILEYAAAVAVGEWRVALAWHALLAWLLIALVAGHRPAARTIAVSMAVGLWSVAVEAARYDNPFNAVVFALVGGGTLWQAGHVHQGAVRFSTGLPCAAAIVLLAFAWAYPHFPVAASSVALLYAAPLGTIPCPTLAAMTGLLLLFNSLGRRPLAILLGGAAIVYGLVGLLYLNVTIDAMLLGGGVFLIATHAMPQRAGRRLGGKAHAVQEESVR